TGSDDLTPPNGRFAIVGTSCNTIGSYCTSISPVGDQPSSILAGNFNADGGGALDLAITDASNTDSLSSQGLLLLTGNGSGGFSGPHGYGTAAKGPEAVVAANFDNDVNHYPDVVVLDKAANQITFMQGVGSGGFVTTGVAYDLDSSGLNRARGPEDITAG